MANISQHIARVTFNLCLPPAGKFSHESRWDMCVDGFFFRCSGFWYVFIFIALDSVGRIFNLFCCCLLNLTCFISHHCPQKHTTFHVILEVLIILTFYGAKECRPPRRGAPKVLFFPLQTFPKESKRTLGSSYSWREIPPKERRCFIFGGWAAKWNVVNCVHLQSLQKSMGERNSTSPWVDGVRKTSGTFWVDGCKVACWEAVIVYKTFTICVLLWTLTIE